MLKSLKIKNIALMRSAEVEFGDNLNVLSGETGSGKSVLVDAINFALGQKADKTMICYGETDCSVTCVFDITNNNAVKDVLDELEIEYDDEVIIKRTLNIDGKGSIKVNGESVNSTMLKKITCLLVDVHGQSEHFLLLNKVNQLSLIDSLDDNIVKNKDKLGEIVNKINEIDNKIDMLGGDEVERNKKIDYLSFAINEIEKVGFYKGEDEELQDKKKLLLNAEKISQACGNAYNDLSDENCSIDLINDAVKKLDSVSDYSSEFLDLSNRLQNALSEIEDIAERINDSLDIEYSPQELEAVESRLGEISSLKKKYGFTFEDMNKTYLEYKEQFELLSTCGEQIEKLKYDKEKLLSEYSKCSKALTTLRKQVSEDFCKKLSVKLKELAMSGGKLDVEFVEKQGVFVNGNDDIEFMFTANIGEQLKPLSKVISGGEMSRLMLGIKCVTNNNVFDKQTFIFDEIDVGISGQTAKVVAENIASISKNNQVIAISHLPQMVAIADSSYLLHKDVVDNRTISTITKLDYDGKVNEIVRLIGGSINNNVSVEHAKLLIADADKCKAN